MPLSNEIEPITMVEISKPKNFDIFAHTKRVCRESFKEDGYLASLVVLEGRKVTVWQILFQIVVRNLQSDPDHDFPTAARISWSGFVMTA